MEALRGLFHEYCSHKDSVECLIQLRVCKTAEERSQEDEASFTLIHVCSRWEYSTRFKVANIG